VRLVLEMIGMPTRGGLALLLLLLVPAPAWAQTDLYGGYTAIPVPGGGTGSFRVAKINGNRWVFVSPLGNAFWLRGVQNARESALVSSVIPTKYGGSAEAWAQTRNERLVSWGMNALGEYTSCRGLPTGCFGGPGPSVPLPFILLLNGGLDGMTNPTFVGLPEMVKDVVVGVPRTTYDAFRGRLVDVFDPKYLAAQQFEVNYWNAIINGGLNANPWIIGITPDDADELFGFKSGGQGPITVYPHPGYMVAVARFRYRASENSYNGQPFADTELHSKTMWIRYLKAVYPSIEALNNAWGTGGFYTSFDATTGPIAGEPLVDSSRRRVTSLWAQLVQGSTTVKFYAIQNGNPVEPGTPDSGPAVTLTDADVGVPISFMQNGVETFKTHIASVLDPYHVTTGTAAPFSSAGTPASNPWVIYRAGDAAPDPTGIPSERVSAWPVWGTANRWAYTSNVPVEAVPMLGVVTVKVNGVPVGDDAAAPGILMGSGIAAAPLSTVDRTTGAVVLYLADAPADGASITLDYTGTGRYGAGTGVIEEDGRHPWIGGGQGNAAAYSFAGVTPAAAADMETFLYFFARQWATVAVTAIRAVDAQHLIFGPDALNNYGQKARYGVLRGIAEGGIDAFQWNYNPVVGANAGSMAENTQSYDLTGKPAFIWYSVTAQAESGMSGEPTLYAQPNAATQALRGERYVSDLATFLNTRGSNGDFYVLGLNWWELVDSPGDGANWGLLSRLDNAYDGREAVAETVTDGDGIMRGGEAANFGDFLGLVTAANATIPSVLAATAGVGRSPTMTSITSPLSAVMVVGEPYAAP
jgi:hypothetical protein